METFNIFINETYILTVGNCLSLKEIYEDYRDWIINKYGIKLWNTITQKHVYTALKNLQEYVLVRHREGLCLKGISRTKNPNLQMKTLNISRSLTLYIVNDKELQQINDNNLQLTDNIIEINILNNTNKINGSETLIPKPDKKKFICPHVQQRIIPTIGFKK